MIPDTGSNVLQNIAFLWPLYPFRVRGAELNNMAPLA